MYYVKANILFILKIATDLISKGNLEQQYYKEVFRAFKRFNETNEHNFYKVYLSEIDLERFNLKYLFYKEDMKELETRFEVLRIGDLFKEHELFFDWKKPSTFDNVILFKRYLTREKLYNIVYVNKRQLKFLLDLEKRNKVKWYKINEEDREIIKRGCFNARYGNFTKKVFIEDIEDLKSITLKDVLSVVPLKLLMFDDSIKTNDEKIDIILTHYYDHCKNFNKELHIEFVYHLRKILTPLFEQIPQDDETYTEDYI